MAVVLVVGVSHRVAVVLVVEVSEVVVVVVVVDGIVVEAADGAVEAGPFKERKVHRPKLSRRVRSYTIVNRNSSVNGR